MSALDVMFTDLRRRAGPHWSATCRPATRPSTGLPELLAAMIDGGCDLVEVGLPFSDPVLDGPVIQHAAQTALAGGFRIRDVFGIVESVTAAGGRAVVMTYFNPVLAYGVDAFARELGAAGGSGVITPDLIVDEAGPWLAAARGAGLDPIFLVAPSSSAERIALTAASTSGFLYVASTMGVTGARDQVSAAAPELVARCRAITDLPLGVGLGVRTGEQAARDRRVRRRGDRRVGVRQRGRTRRAGRGRRELAAELAAGIDRPPRGGANVRPARRDPLSRRPSRHRRRASGTSGRSRCGPTRSASSSASSSPSGGATSGSSPAVAGRGRVTDISVFAVPFGIIGGRIYHVITDNQLYFGEGTQPVERVRHLERRARDLGGDRLRRGRRLDRLPLLQGAAVAVRRLGGPRHRRRAGHRPARQLLQPGAVRRADLDAVGAGRLRPHPRRGRRRVPADGVCEFPTDYIKATPEVLCGVYQPTFLYEILWNCAVAVVVVLADRRFKLGGGRAFAVYVAGYTLGRTWIEMLRIDPANHIFGVADQRLHLGDRVPRARCCS